MATNAGVPHLDQPIAPSISTTGALVGAFFVAWFALVLVLGSAGAFVGAPGAPPIAFLIALLVPLALYAVGYRAIPALRSFILSADPRIIAGIQAWRWAGFGFLALHSYRILPGIFAWPAGLGDMAIGMTAPLVLAALLRSPDFAASRRFVAWNISGIVDLVVAVSVGAVVPLVAPELYAGVSTSPMARMPLVLIPTFLVPSFLMLHVTALLHVRHLRRLATR